jgi:hypothetical protein
MYKDMLLWNAAIDLILADRLVAESRYSWSFFSREMWSGTTFQAEGVNELRGRVLYVIEALSLIHHEALSSERALRLSSEPVSTPPLEDALEWFRSFAAAADELAPSENNSEGGSWLARFRGWLDS